MAYSRTNWKDKVVSTPNKYKDQSNVSYTFTPDEGVVTEAGTPVNAGNMNKIDLTLFINNNIFACTGSANTYATTIAGITAIADLVGIPFAISLNIDASAASTLNVNGYGAHAILKPNGVGFVNGKLNGIYTMIWNGTNFILQGSDSSGNAIPADLLNGKTASTDVGDIVGTRTKFSYTEVGKSFPMPIAMVSSSAIPLLVDYVGYAFGDKLGNMYLYSYYSSTSTYMLTKFTNLGVIVFSTTFPADNYSNFLFDNDNNLFLIRPNNKDIIKIDKNTGTIAKSVTTSYACYHITVDSSGNIYSAYTDSISIRVYKYTNDLVFVSSIVAFALNTTTRDIVWFNDNIYVCHINGLVRIKDDLSEINATYAGGGLLLDIISDNCILVTYNQTPTYKLYKLSLNGSGFDLIWNVTNYRYYRTIHSNLGVYVFYSSLDSPYACRAGLLDSNSGSIISSIAFGFNKEFSKTNITDFYDNGTFYVFNSSLSASGAKATLTQFGEYFNL